MQEHQQTEGLYQFSEDLTQQYYIPTDFDMSFFDVPDMSIPMCDASMAFSSNNGLSPFSRYNSTVSSVNYGFGNIC